MVLFRWIRLFLAFSSFVFVHAQGQRINITFDPPQLEIKVRQTLPINFNITISLNGVSNYDQATFEKLQITSEHPDIAEIHNSSAIDLSWHALISQPKTFQFYVTGRFTGRTKLKMEAWKLPNPHQGVLLLAEYPVAVLRMDAMTTLSFVFTITMFTLIVINTFVMGMQLDWRIILNVFKRPIAPLIGFGCQYVIMPLISTAWAFVLLSGIPYLQFGYFAVGCAPGGGVSNFWTLLLDGNLDLSVTMTFCSNIAALAMMPFWLYTMGRVFFTQAGGERLAIPFVNIIVSLLLLIGPVFAGITVAHFKPKLVHKSKKYVKISTIFVMAVAIVFGGIANAYVLLLMTWRTLLAGLLLPWTGFVLSYVIAYLTGQDHRNCRTIAIETGIQNAGIAIVLLQTSLKPPESDLAMVMPVCVLIFTPIPLIVALIVNTILTCMKKKREKLQLDTSIDLVDFDQHENDSNILTQLEAKKGKEAEPMIIANGIILPTRKSTQV